MSLKLKNILKVMMMLTATCMLPTFFDMVCCDAKQCQHFQKERDNYRMAKAAKRLNAILDYMKRVKSSISMVFGLVF